MDIEWGGLGLVLVISLALGAGLVALVGLGILALDQRMTAQRSGRGTVTPTAAMATCFLAAAALIGYGLYLVATG